MPTPLLVAICQTIREGCIYLSHHWKLFRQPKRPIPDEALYDLICDEQSEIIEHNEDGRGPSILVWGKIDGRVAHVLCSHPPVVAIITAYWPDEKKSKWTHDYKRRVRVRG